MGGRRPRRTYTVPVRVVEGARSHIYLEKAKGHYESALQAAAAQRWDSAVLLAVHCGISAADAACVRAAGVRSVSPNHADQVRLVRQVFEGEEEAENAARQLAGLIDIKNVVEYEARRCTPQEAERALVRAERVLRWAERVCGGTGI